MVTEQAFVVPLWLNTVMKLILRSPFHFLVSAKIMLVTFTGRKTGHIYSTPVSYLQEQGKITMFTHGKWWRNLTNGAPVTLRVRGKNHPVAAELITEDVDVIAERLAVHLQSNRFDAKVYGVSYDEQGKPNPDEVRRASAQGVVMIRFKPA
jgi:deazaflavin-dependent oxidoreductase (nitroreductase family)